MKKHVVFCDYCGGPTEFVDSAEVYRRSYGMIYLCRSCNAWVGVHKGSSAPLGRLADKTLRCWKMAAHEAFDPIWKRGKMHRNEAYTWLAVKMGIPRKRAHIAMFDVAQCKQVIEICKERKQLDEQK